ncbi:hypothetical protein [Mycobacteroides salmoniphilum]|uniref:hypothetical protein n=1 Tax=Mycobacteroides salmoniphilum TaxID=404941 RepID=UPI00178601E6|nr:hypothetical protein [Mycobacteroides salmoniphilum]
MMKFFCAAAVLTCSLCGVPVAAADPPPITPMPAVPVAVPGGAPNNHAALPSQPSFGLSPPPQRGTQITAGLGAGYTARIGAGMTSGELEDPRGTREGTIR